MATITLTGISRKFTDTTAVDHVDLSVDDGDFLVLLGPSGCGKTTLLRMIAGLLEPTTGSILLDGTDITHLPSKQRDLAMVFQSYALYPHMSVRKNLAFPLTIQKLSKAEIASRVEDVAHSLEIHHLLERKPRELSGGQRQRVAVGRALVRNPKAYLMDEPLSNLDAKLRTQTRRELTELHRKLGATFVYVTHDQVEAMTMATKIVVLNNGRIEQFGTPEAVYDKPASTFVASFVGSPATNLIDARINTSDHYLSVEAPNVTGTLWPGVVDEMDVILGVRPEHLKIVDTESFTAPYPTRGINLTGTVDIVENLGNEIIIGITVGSHQVQVRSGRDTRVTPGETLTVTAALEHVHLFDAETGGRLEWISESEDSVSPTHHHELTAV